MFPEAAVFRLSKKSKNGIMPLELIRRDRTAMKKFSLLFLSLFTLFSLSACGRQEGPPPEDGTARETVQLTVWGAEEDEALL